MDQDRRRRVFVYWWLSFHLKCTYHATRSICHFCPNRQRICFSRLNFLWETIATVLWKVSGNAIDAFRSEGYCPVNVVLGTNKIESKRCDVSRLFFPRCFKYSIQDFLIKKIHWNLSFFPHFWPFSFFFSLCNLKEHVLLQNEKFHSNPIYNKMLR